MSELKFTVGYGRTVNLRNNESVRFDLTIEFNKEMTTIEDAWMVVKTQVDHQIKKLLGYEELTKLWRYPPKCLSCGTELPCNIEQTGSHDPSCPWNYFITCEHCNYQNSLSKLLGFWAGCSKKCVEVYKK